MSGFLNLRGCILSNYKTIGEFAKAANWSRSKAARIINGQQHPDVEDIHKLVNMLNINDSDVFMQIFFAPLSTKWTQAS
jgi:predicted transcriptional regulator